MLHAIVQLYTGIDLHSSNSYLAIIDEHGKRVFKKKLPDDLEQILSALGPYKDAIISSIQVSVEPPPAGAGGCQGAGLLFRGVRQIGNGWLPDQVRDDGCGGDNKKGHGINRDPFIYMVGDAGFEPATPAV